MLSFTERLQDAIELVQHAQRIVALTGAGISTESGIPDFRSPGSPWLEQPPVSYKAFISSAEARRQYWQSRRNLSGQVATARPNAAHYALAELEQRGKLLGIITQNFDGLHHDAGNQPERIVELHGTSREAACTLCGARSSMQALQRRIDAGEVDPTCPECGGLPEIGHHPLRPACAGARPDARKRPGNFLRSVPGGRIVAQGDASSEPATPGARPGYSPDNHQPPADAA